MNEPQVESGQRVTPLELFFDLVFVFAITQVTGFLADDPTVGGLFRGLLRIRELSTRHLRTLLEHVSDRDLLTVEKAIRIMAGAAAQAASR